MIELNVSCPNVETGLVMGADPAETARAVERTRPLTEKPLIVKLTPNAAEPQAVAAAAARRRGGRGVADQHAEGHGAPPAHALAVAGRRIGRRLGPRGARDRPRAGLHGRPRVQIPVIGMGGIQTGRHAADFVAAGAAAVAVGTESFRDPAAGARVADELAVILASERGISGSAETPAGSAWTGLTKKPLQRRTKPSSRPNPHQPRLEVQPNSRKKGAKSVDAVLVRV